MFIEKEREFLLLIKESTNIMKQLEGKNNLIEGEKTFRMWRAQFVISSQEATQEVLEERTGNDQVGYGCASENSLGLRKPCYSHHK